MDELADKNRMLLARKGIEYVLHFVLCADFSSSTASLEMIELGACVFVKSA